MTSWRFWYLGLAICIGFVYWGFMMSTYKDVGLYYIDDDYLMTMIGTIGNVAGTVGRMLWPSLLDFVPFRFLMFGILISNAIIATTLPLAFTSKFLFTVLVVPSFFTSTGIFPAIMAESGKQFGNRGGAIIVSFLVLPQTAGVFLQTGLQALVSVIGYAWILQIIAMITGMGAMMVLTTSPKTGRKVIREKLEPLI